jgi:hypothetical protein
MGMHRPPRLLSCLLVAVAMLVSGCGSTKKTGASSAASQNASTGASANLGAQTVPRGASTKESQHAQKAVKPKTAEAKPERKVTAAEAEEGRRIQQKQKTNERAAARVGLQAAERDVPLKRRYPKELQGKFMRACKAARGSTSSCECIIARQEANLKVERGQTLAELLALEIAFEREHASLEDIRRRRVPAPRLVRRVVRACR